MQKLTRGAQCSRVLSSECPGTCGKVGQLHVCSTATSTTFCACPLECQLLPVQTLCLAVHDLIRSLGTEKVCVLRVLDSLSSEAAVWHQIALRNEENIWY